MQYKKKTILKRKTITTTKIQRKKNPKKDLIFQGIYNLNSK